MITGRTLVAGHARGVVLKLDVPLSFWGGVDLSDGTIVDRTQPAYGVSMAGRVLVMPSGRGSSSSSSAVVELARAGMAPLSIVMLRHDPILVIGALVAAELYEVEIPIVTISGSDWNAVAMDATIQIDAKREGAVLIVD